MQQQMWFLKEEKEVMAVQRTKGKEKKSLLICDSHHELGPHLAVVEAFYSKEKAQRVQYPKEKLSLALQLMQHHPIEPGKKKIRTF